MHCANVCILGLFNNCKVREQYWKINAYLCIAITKAEWYGREDIAYNERHREGVWYLHRYGFAGIEGLSPHQCRAPCRNSAICPFTHFYFSSVLSGIEQEASARGYRIMVAQSDECYEREVKICQSFFENKVCGVIVSQAKDTQKYDHFQRLIDAGVPLVFYDRICTGVNASRVVVDDYMGAFNAVTHLIETGCHRIAFYGSSMTLEISKNRYNGYRDALLKHGVLPDDSLIRFCDNRADAEAITPEILQMENRPDGFFAVNDDTAIGILYTAKRMGLRVPDDVSICGFTNGQRAVACDPMLTTVEQRGIMVGEEAANILIGQVEETIPREKIVRRIVRTRLIIRGTTR